MSNIKLGSKAAEKTKKPAKSFAGIFDGEGGEADNGNRTRILSLEGFCLTLRRYPQGVERLALRENDGLLLGKSGVRHKPERSAWDSNPRMNVDVQ